MPLKLLDLRLAELPRAGSLLEHILIVTLKLAQNSVIALQVRPLRICLRAPILRSRHQMKTSTGRRTPLTQFSS